MNLTRPLVLLFLIVGLGCAPAAAGSDSASTDSSRPWWRDAVFYEIFVRSFYDSDGDGIGDFNGITAKLDYLQKLGISGIWLMPIHPSPSYHGYDVTDYYAVNPDYGTMEDFTTMLASAHDRGIRVIFDLVLNHTSNQHPFFKEALRDPGSERRDWYIWSETDHGNGWHSLPTGYYYGLFCSCMPDLNYRNPAVTAEIENVVQFWLEDVGVDGFRVDAAKHLIEEGAAIENTTATHDWYEDFYESYKAANQQSYAIGEVYGAGALLVKSYTGNQLDQVFSFEMASGIMNSATGGSNTAFSSALTFALQDMPDFNFATFLTNHDQNRALSVFRGDIGKARVAAALLLTSPGTPFIYYGEEIGMQGVKPDEDIRLPMQWSAEESGGFTSGRPWRAPAGDYAQVNVEAQDNLSTSLLNLYRGLIVFRSAHPALRAPHIVLLRSTDPGLYASLRIADAETLLVLINLTDTPITEFMLSAEEIGLPDGSYTAELLIDGTIPHGGGAVRPTGPTIQNGMSADYRPFETLPAYSIYIIKLTPQN